MEGPERKDLAKNSWKIEEVSQRDKAVLWRRTLSVAKGSISESTYNVLAESISEVRIRETENEKELVRKQESDYKRSYTVTYKVFKLFVACGFNCVSRIMYQSSSNTIKPFFNEFRGSPNDKSIGC